MSKLVMCQSETHNDVTCLVEFGCLEGQRSTLSTHWRETGKRQLNRFADGGLRLLRIVPNHEGRPSIIGIRRQTSLSRTSIAPNADNADMEGGKIRQPKKMSSIEWANGMRACRR